MPDERPASCIYFGRVVHRRTRPVAHRFQYRVWSLFADVDELPTIAARIPIFSFNRANVFSFVERDHGPRDGSPLRPWIERHLRSAGIDATGGPVRILCFPRLFGYVFNPLSVWFCHHPSGRLAAVLLQVSNMSGEWHNYLFSVDETDRLGSAHFEKRFSVSAFTSMNARYECALVEPHDRFDVRVSEFEHDVETLTALWVGERSPMTTRTLAYALVRYPLMTFKIWTAIYWQAVQLIRKGVPRQPQTTGPDVEVTYATAGTVSAESHR
jgi:DUF1365 family protein